jgi:hypothetical protein
MLLELLLFIGTGMLPSQQCLASDGLGVRNGHAMAYDRDREVVMLFGGADERQVLADLQLWDGKQWRCVSDQGPPKRTFPGLAYDSARKQLVLFGGNRVLFGTEADRDTFLDDMWIWDGMRWTEFDGDTPPARAEPAMVFDSSRERIVLFGGHRTSNGQRLRLGDTWEWDGRRWEQRHVKGPPARNGASMAFDSDRNRVVLFGGSGATGDTWEWDGNHWRRIASADAEGRFNSVMAYDEAENLLIRFGGWTGISRVGDTWKYNGTQWRKILEEGPPGRNHSAMAYDSNRKVIVLFGGHDGERVFGDTWELHSGSWNLKSKGAARLRIANGH